MGTVPLLTREGEIELAKRIERGNSAVEQSTVAFAPDRHENLHSERKSVTARSVRKTILSFGSAGGG